MGVNAIHRAAGALGRLAAFEPAVVHVEGLAFRESLQVVHVGGGVASNVVPDRCELVVNRRYAPGPSATEAEADVRALLDDADVVELVSLSPAAAPHLDDPLIAELVGTLDLAVRPKLGWTDVARFTAHGIPAVNLGPGDPELADTPEEAVDRESLDGCYGVLGAFLGIG